MLPTRRPDTDASERESPPRLRVPRLRGPALLLACLGLAACGGDPVTTGPDPGPPDTPHTPLRALAQQHQLWFGTAVGSNFGQAGPQGAQYTEILAREFSLLTAENDMKFGPLRPSRSQYRFQRADSLVAFAEANQMKVRGHTLVWHNQLAGWLTGGAWTGGEVREILEEHIRTVVGRYRGRIAAWDVVNEAVDDDGVLRASFWASHLGRDYLELAFRAAHEADPEALLFYNDYNLEWPDRPKTDSVYTLLGELLARGVPIHGIGFQGHFLAGGIPSRQEIMQTFARFAALGLRIQITELDIRVQLPATAEKLETQAENYREVVSACLETPACDAVVVWGLHDGNSWVPQAFPGQGAALLFDAGFAAKPAYWAVHRLLSGQ